MIVAHLSDLHLGFRAYGRVERGSDVRERDVAAAFERAVQELVSLRPAVVVLAGDVFDRPDPPAGAVVALARGLEVLRGALPETLILMVAGPRDTPRREGDPGALAVLDTFSNVEAATGLTRSILVERLDLHACLVPYRAAVRNPPVSPEPDPRKRWNLLVVHAEVGLPGDERGLHVDPREWDYVALGGEHRRRRVGPRVGYSGALERVALDPWDEATDEKGFLTFDLETGRSTFHAVPSRPVVALAPVRVGSGDPDRVRRRVEEVTREVPGGLDGKIVRLRLQGAAPSDLLALQGTQLTDLRQRALHLAVEAGRDLEVPVGAWLQSDVARALREATAAELDRDGALDRLAVAATERLIRDPVGPRFEVVGRLDALDGDLPGLGRVSTSILPGVTAVFGGGGRARRAVAELFVRVGGGTASSAVARLWAGTEAETLDGMIRRAIEAVAETRGIGLIDEAFERAGALPPPEHAAAAAGAARPSQGAIRVDPDQVAAEFRAAERELRDLRADVAEADGDLEVSTMDWLRERQDAETMLQTYRDRARELRSRIRKLEVAGPQAPCPTCGRVLEAHYDEVLSELRDEWEGVVQDGSWWRSRWAQLELKPPRLQEFEGRSLRLHAALEAGSERLELLRARMSELGGRTKSHAVHATLAGPERMVVEALERVRSARMARATDMLLDRASRFICRISGGRILALSWDGDRALLQGTGGVLTPLSEEDLAAARIAVRLAGASLVAGRGEVLASLPIEEPFDRMDEETRIRTLVLLRSLVPEIPRLVVFTRGESVDARPELFDAILEVRDESTSGALVRPVAAGPGRVTLEAVSASSTTKPGGA